MDGLKKSITESIQFKLSFWFIFCVLTLGIVTVTAIYFIVSNETKEIQDNSLAQIYLIINKHENFTNFSNTNPNLESKVLIHAIPDENPKNDDAIAKHLRDLNQLPYGFHTLNLDGKSYRVFIKPSINNKHKIFIGQPTELLDDVVEGTVFTTLIMLSILIPLLILISIATIRSELNPIVFLSKHLNNRKDQDLSTLPIIKIPTEISPFITSINRLLHKSSEAIQVQKRFIDDAAHELRSPLTAISLQAERLEMSEMSDQARERLNNLKLGIDRSLHLLEQLLSLSRAQNVNIKTKKQCSSIKLISSVLEDLMPIAEAKKIDVEVNLGIEKYLYINELDLSCILKNLIDNAIKYSPNHGKVNITLDILNDKYIFVVEDNGIGVSDNEYERVFDPFYRTLGNENIGSGLGLSIVKILSEKLAISITLSKSDRFSTGLKVTLSVPYESSETS